MRKTRLTTLLTGIVLALTVVARPVHGQNVHVINTQTDFDNLAVTDGDKVVFRGPGPFVGTLQIVGVQDVTVAAAHSGNFVGHGSVGNGGSTFVPAAVPTLDAGTNSLCIRILQSRRIRVVGLRLQGRLGVQAVNSEDVQILGNEMRVEDGGVRIGNGLRAVVASNRIEPDTTATTHVHGFGVAIVGGLDNTVFDNYITESIDTGILVDTAAQRTAMINNHIEDGTPSTAPFGPAFGIWDEGQRSCLLRNTVDGDHHPFLVGCDSTLIGNVGNPSGQSMFCNVPVPATFPVENSL